MGSAFPLIAYLYTKFYLNATSSFKVICRTNKAASICQAYRYKQCILYYNVVEFVYCLLKYKTLYNNKCLGFRLSFEYNEIFQYVLQTESIIYNIYQISVVRLVILNGIRVKTSIHYRENVCLYLPLSCMQLRKVNKSN